MFDPQQYNIEQLEKLQAVAVRVYGSLVNAAARFPGGADANFSWDGQHVTLTIFQGEYHFSTRIEYWKLEKVPEDALIKLLVRDLQFGLFRQITGLL